MGMADPGCFRVRKEMDLSKPIEGYYALQDLTPISRNGKSERYDPILVERADGARFFMHVVMNDCKALLWDYERWESSLVPADLALYREVEE